MAPSTNVPEYYANKSIFITGATGFMGKVLVEKLLRCCPDLKRIYLLLRSKKGQSSRERLEDFVNCRLFDKMHDFSPKSFNKLRLVSGDILLENMAISEHDRAELERETNIVFHCAACVRFDQNLRDAVNLNTGGTSKILRLAEKMTQLEAFIHVSTTYCRCELEVLEEKLYPTKHKPQHVMDCVGWMDEDILKHLEHKLIEPQPNTYAYTKSLTEQLVSEYEGKFPIAIARPAIVTAAYKEPLPGWVDNLNGPTGLLVGAGKGVIRTMHCQETLRADVVPVDMVVNGCILLAYTIGIDRPKEIRVINISESGVNPLTWGAAIDMGRNHVHEFPFSICLWYPGGTIKSSKLHHQIALIFTHILPAYFIDMLLFLMGKKTFMIKIQRKVSSGLEVLQYYTTKQWNFRNDNFVALRKRVSPEDDKIFYTDLKMVNWNNYIREYMKGAREFCCKEDPATLPQARKLHKQLYYVDRASRVFLLSIVAYLIFSYLKVIFNNF